MTSTTESKIWNATRFTRKPTRFRKHEPRVHIEHSGYYYVTKPRRLPNIDGVKRFALDQTELTREREAPPRGSGNTIPATSRAAKRPMLSEKRIVTKRTPQRRIDIAALPLMRGDFRMLDTEIDTRHYDIFVLAVCTGEHCKSAPNKSRIRACEWVNPKRARMRCRVCARRLQMVINRAERNAPTVRA